MIQGVPDHALQMGTVMTHPDYRGKGLAKKLMNYVLKEIEAIYDFLYLFANLQVLDFYPKFGFRRAEEHQFSLDYLSATPLDRTLRKLDMRSEEDLDFLHQFAKERVPVSASFSTVHASSIFMYHSLNAFCDNIWYLESEDAVILFKKHQDRIDIFDIISRQKASLSFILKSMSGEGPAKVVFHYTPDNEEFELECVSMKKEGALFEKMNGQHSFPSPIRHPVTFEA